MLNIIKVVDAVDYDKSILKKLDTGLVVGFNKYEFKEDMLEGLSIFKILFNGRVRNTDVLVSSSFKQKVEALKLKGFKFIEIWDSKQIDKISII